MNPPRHGPGGKTPKSGGPVKDLPHRPIINVAPKHLKKTGQAE